MIKRKIKGSILATIGYFLSPVSWWNDLFINIPLAYVFALPFGFISKSLFYPAIIIGYWITNVLGFILMHHGIKDILNKKSNYTKKELIQDLIISVIYTILVIVLILLGWLKFPTEYFT